MVRDPPVARDRPADPLPRVKVKINGAQHKGLILFKGKPYLWLATHPCFVTNQPIPNIGVKVKIDGAYDVGRAWWHPDKIPSSSQKPKSDQTPALKLKNGQLTLLGPKIGGANCTPSF